MTIVLVHVLVLEDRHDGPPRTSHSRLDAVPQIARGLPGSRTSTVTCTRARGRFAEAVAGDAWEPPPPAPALGALAASVPSANERALRESHATGWWVNLGKDHPGIETRLQALADALNPDRQAPPAPVHSHGLEQLQLWGKDTDTP